MGTYHKKYAKVILMLLPILFPAGITHGDESMTTMPDCFTQYITESIIDGNALGDTKGVIAVNIAAGDANVQANAAAVAVSDGGSVAARIGMHQHTEVGQGNSPDVAIARIGGAAFSNAKGLISVNQASGQGNAQANGIAIAIGGKGVEVVAESVLSATVTGQGVQGPGESSLRAEHRVAVESSAFEGAVGVVQINQLAGSGNAGANSLAIRVSAGQ